MVIEKTFYDMGYSYRKEGNRWDFYKDGKKISELIFFESNVMYINDVTYQEGSFVKIITVDERGKIKVLLG